MLAVSDSAHASCFDATFEEALEGGLSRVKATFYQPISTEITTTAGAKMRALVVGEADDSLTLLNEKGKMYRIQKDKVDNVRPIFYREIVTKSGGKMRGEVVEETSDSLTLATADGKKYRIQKDKIAPSEPGVQKGQRIRVKSERNTYEGVYLSETDESLYILKDGDTDAIRLNKGRLQMHRVQTATPLEAGAKIKFVLKSGETKEGFYRYSNDGKLFFDMDPNGGNQLSTHYKSVKMSDIDPQQTRLVSEFTRERVAREALENFNAQFDNDFSELASMYRQSVPGFKRKKMDLIKKYHPDRLIEHFPFSDGDGAKAPDAWAAINGAFQKVSQWY